MDASSEKKIQMDAYVSGEVLWAAVVAAAPAHGDDLVVHAGLLEAHQRARHPRRHGPPVHLHWRHCCDLSLEMICDFVCVHMHMDLYSSSVSTTFSLVL